MQRSERVGSPRRPVTTKITDALRIALDAAAVENDRTLGAEIEHRLKASFDVGTRQVIREEIRAAFADRDEAQRPNGALLGSRGKTLSDIDIPLLGLPGPPLNG